ncbi:hypothetical protein QY884_07320 [Latilactobacillus sakei]
MAVVASSNGDSNKRRSNDNRGDSRKKTDGRSKRNFTIRTNDK